MPDFDGAKATANARTGLSIVALCARGIGYAALFSCLASTAVSAQTREVEVRTDGTVAFRGIEVPPTPYLSDEGHQSRIEHILTERQLSGLPVEEFNKALFGPRLERTKAAYPVTIEAGKIAGIPVLTYQSSEGVAEENRDKVIVNLHGGGFAGCFVECGGLESIPVAAIGKVRVVSIDYRVYPKATFPAASDDVEAVYRELLRTYAPEDIAIFGCSAGGSLTAQALARFHAVGLPQPAAAAILCAGGGLGFGGDSMTTGMILGDGEMPRPPGGQPGGYFATASRDDPTASPADHPETLAAFPPTLVALGTRDFAMSGAVQLHRRLVAQGVRTQLHMWDGGRHAFFYDVRVPESQEVFRILTGFLLEEINRN